MRSSLIQSISSDKVGLMSGIANSITSGSALFWPVAVREDWIDHHVLSSSLITRPRLPSVGNNITLLQYILQYYCNISYCNIITIQYMAVGISCNTILELSIPIYIADYCNIGIAFFAVLEHLSFSSQGQFYAHLTSTSTCLLQIE